MSTYIRDTSGLIIPRAAKKRKPIAIDIFAGAGGFSLGIMQAGFEVVAGIDWDVEASITYMVNLGAFPMSIHFVEPSDKERMEKKLKRMFKGKKQNGIDIIPFTTGSGYIKHETQLSPVKHFWLGDVRKLSGQNILTTLGLKQEDVDLVVGGPPCQGFSTAGKRDVMDPRNSLVFDYARLIVEIKPKAYVMENVPGIVSMVTPEGIPVVDAFCKILSEGGFAGYDALKKMLKNTSGVGMGIKGGGENATRPKAKAQENKPPVSDKALEQALLF